MPNAMAAIAHAHRGQVAVAEPPKICNWWTVPDHHWVGVLRTAPGCTRHTNHWACDGLCTQPGATGMEGDDSKDVIRERKYGCWFYTMFNASSSSAAYVNVGRSLRAVTRCGVGFLLGLHKPNSTGVESGKGGTNLCEHEDRLWCDRAIARGYDSIQLLRGTYYDAKGKRRAFGELVICTDECTSKPFENYACVPAARRITEGGAVAPCDCPNNALSLSCDGIHRVPPAPDTYATKHGAMNQTACAAAFKWLDSRPDRPDRIIGAPALHALPDTQCRLDALTANMTEGPIPVLPSRKIEL